MERRRQVNEWKNSLPKPMMLRNIEPYIWKKIEREKVKKKIRKRECHEVKYKSTKRNRIPQIIHGKWIKVWLIGTREGETKCYKNHISWIHNSLSLNDYTYIFTQSCCKTKKKFLILSEMEQKSIGK